MIFQDFFFIRGVKAVLSFPFLFLYLIQFTMTGEPASQIFDCCDLFNLLSIFLDCAGC